MEKTNTTFIVSLLIVLSLGQKAKADVFDAVSGVFKENANYFRRSTSGQIFDQKFRGKIGSGELNSIKQRMGGDYGNQVEDWCRRTIINSDRYYRRIPPISNINYTWREENGEANCYERVRH